MYRQRTRPSPGEAARDAILALPDLRFAPLRAAFLWFLDEARQFPPLREDTHFYLTTPIPVLRRIFAEMGHRLVAVGILNDRADIYHLRLADLEHLADHWPPSAALQADLRAAIAERRARRDALRRVPMLPQVAASTTTPRMTPSPTQDAGQSRVASGPVRLVHGPAEFGLSMQPGDIVGRSLHQSGVDPALRPCRGCHRGCRQRHMSHAAIVAREYGLPAVMGTRDALTRLQDGQQVIVDGTRGLVFAEG